MPVYNAQGQAPTYLSLAFQPGVVIAVPYSCTPYVASTGPSVDFSKVRYLDYLRCGGYQRFVIDFCKVEEMFGG